MSQTTVKYRQNELKKSLAWWSDITEMFLQMRKSVTSFRCSKVNSIGQGGEKRKDATGDPLPPLLNRN